MPREPDIVFYDGECGFCHAGVKFVVNRDARARFRFAPLGGTTFHEHMAGNAAADLAPNSMIVLTPDGRTLTYSTASIHLLRELGGVWSICAAAIWIVPWPLRDAAYRLIARVRRKLSATPTGVCPLVPDTLKSRFLP